MLYQNEHRVIGIPTMCELNDDNYGCIPEFRLSLISNLNSKDDLNILNTRMTTTNGRFVHMNLLCQLHNSSAH